MTNKRTRSVNDRGIGLKGINAEIMKDIRVYDEDGRVQIWVEIDYGVDGQTREVLQYLTAEEAMAFAKAFERCAIQALRDAS